MEYIISVKRRKRDEKNDYYQDFLYIADSENDTVATALTNLNLQEPLMDINGLPTTMIEWECSCLQKKCGACAMVINGRPGLACAAKLKDYKKKKISLEPLRKFPVIADLMVDRSILYENLKTLTLWLRKDIDGKKDDPEFGTMLCEKDSNLAYTASECIQCGCCLEVCPNFYPGGSFFGMSTVPVTTRLLTEMSSADIKKIAKGYMEYVYEGCGKSLACMDICPRKIPTDKLMVNSNALIFWKRRKKDVRK
ncbi:MAG: succinate dehydrogenase [Lachnospiraceae bacterium]|nr:succinate dehydrogenase [Lachnospiraceae bacterium]